MQLHYQHPPPYHLTAATSGTTQFHSFVSLPLVLVMSEPRAIGRDSPGKNRIRCQTLFFLAQLHGAGTMCLFSPHPQTSSALPFSSLLVDPPILYPSAPVGTWCLCTSHLGVSKKGSRAVKPAGLTHFPLLGGDGLTSQLSERRGWCVFNPPLPLHPEQIVFNSFLQAAFLSLFRWQQASFPFSGDCTRCPDVIFLTLHNSIARARWNLLEHGWYAQALEPA